ncbi:MAG: LamG domain-containing protein [Acidobacteria bacterium]|nr:LamG domain-containing protein [Acidobacteriota bacterium]
MRILLLGLSVSTLLLGQTPPAETWRFDRLDRLGAHPTHVEGAPRVVETPQGKAVSFDGVRDALFVDVHPLAGAETFTLEVIFRPAADGRPEQRFFHLQETGAPTRLLLETRLLPGGWCLDSFAASSSGSKALIDRQKLHSLGTWHHVAMVYDGTTFRHFVDGVSQGEAAVGLALQAAGRTSVGVRINRVDYFKGEILVARMSRRALAVKEFLPVPR